MKNIRKEKGVALLFSLGVMSLMLVTGLAFLANALTSQKIAVNNSSRGQSKMLALSAAHRSMHSLMTFLNTYKDDCRLGTMESVFSRVASDGTNDQLAQKLTVKQDNNTFYDASGTQAKWIYVHENGTDSDGLGTSSSKIIGRYAFQVLPPLQSSKSRLSLFAATRGASMEAGEGMAKYTTSSTKRVPQISRWGIDGDELNFSTNAIFPLWIAGSNPAAPIKEFDTFFSVLSYTGGPLKKATTDGAQATIDNRRRGIRYWFTEGIGRISPETYFDGTVWRHRFNLGRIDGLIGSPVPKTATEESAAASTEKDRRWYQRLIAGNTKTTSSIMNTESAVNALAGTAIEYSSTDVSSTDGSAQNGSVSGLPFLKRIAHDPGSFETLEKRRKQIAANLNDYCDADDIPTSDVLANTWTSDDVYKNRTSRPSFTGNEKTPYLNEIGLQFVLAIGSWANGSGQFSSKKVKNTITVTPKMLVELIDVYGGLSQYSPAVKMYISNLEITLNLTASCSFNYTYGDNGSGTFSGSVSVEGTTSAFNGDFSGTMSNWTNGYFSASSALTAQSVTLDLSQKLADETGQTLTGISDFTWSSVNLSVSKVVFNISDIVVYKKNSSDLAVDYVKMPSSVITVTSSDSAHAVSLLSTKKELNSNVKVFQYLGGMEVRDPRQNLNVYQDEAKSDWLFKPVIGTKDVLSMNFDTEIKEIKIFGYVIYRYTKEEELINGKVNSCSNPSAPKDGTGVNIIAAANRDLETVTDLAATSGDTESPQISTAVIRNAPMRSPWELGFISRGEAFQTINLKKAGGFYETDGSATSAIALHASPSDWERQGTKYSEGDGGILDEIKMTDHVKSFGKVNLNAFGDTPPTGIAPAAADVGKAIFQGIRRQTAAQFMTESFKADFAKDVSFPQTSSGLTGSAPSADGTGLASDDLKTFWSNLIYRSQILQNDLAKTFFIDSAAGNDAAQEELVGKTINLLDTSRSGQPDLPNVFRIVVVAQTIRDLSGTVGRTGTGASATSATNNSPDQVYTQTCTTGTFDVNSTVSPARYYDEILSEVRMLVTVERINYYETANSNVYRVPKARLRIRQIEYLD